MSEHHEVVVIGAGISGIAAAIKLREAGVADVVVLEKAGAYGGTWRANTYPGCACDVPSALYSYSFAPRGDWSRLFAEQPEILEYVGDVARRHQLEEITRFGVEMTSAQWDETTQQWCLETSAGSLSARFLVSAAGPWDAPQVPDVPGLADFPGEVFHSARWNHDYDLSGKRVAVIGSGASAVQFVPEIQPLVGSLHLFQRTAHWVLPKLDRPVPGVGKWALRRLPLAHRVLASTEYTLMELVGLAFHRPKPLMHALMGLARAYLWATVRDPGLRDRLTPRYLLGCKRILFSNDWFRALTRSNVAVHATGVDGVRGSTVVGADGSEAEVDAIVLGTGFKILDMPVAERVRDAGGRTLAEHWDGSPEAYLGTMVAGFPNAFIVLGPSLGTGHSSAFTIAETQVRLIVQAIEAVRAEGWSSIAVRPEAQQEYVEQVQAALTGTAYNLSSCHSYYVDANGRNSFSWPWSTGELVRRVGRFRPEHYVITPARALEVSA